ncbi:hypothetical protein [Pseudonocardia sp. GCM10023141]|uniref:hypothetical protein n=1 Tax=Pseudonocardia sp. GCM10023141 TaxID=3252653 RepID=UPI003614CE48
MVRSAIPARHIASVWRWENHATHRCKVTAIFDELDDQVVEAISKPIRGGGVRVQ